MENIEFGFGVVKVYFPLKGYGFITRDKGREIFFHRKDVGDEVWALEGVRVRFLIEKTGDGFKAINVKKVG
jgi:CspA family cold shock protein